MDQDAHVIRKRAERARAAIAADVDAIGEKLNVKKQAVQKKDELVDQFKEKVGMSHDGEETRLGHEAHTVMDVVRSHPMATIMAGVGGVGVQRIVAAWRDQHQSYPHSSNGIATGTYSTFDPTAQSSSNGSSKVDDARAKAHDVADTARERVSDVGGKVGELGSTAKDSVTGVASSAKESVTGVASTVTEKLPSDRTELETSMRSNMTLWGGAAFALGAAIGSLIPATKLEREKLGSVTDSAVDMAKDKASDAKQALEAGLDVAKDHAQELVSDVKDHAKDAVSEAKDTAKQEMTGSTGEEPEEETTSTGFHALEEAETVKRPGPILGSREVETSTTDSVIPGGPIRPL